MAAYAGRPPVDAEEFAFDSDRLSWQLGFRFDPKGIARGEA